MKHLLAIAAIKVGERCRKRVRNIESLAASMDRNGLLQPIGVSSDGLLVFGMRRLLAAQKLGWDTIPVRIVDLEEPLLAERDENEEREPFTVSERVAIGKAIEEKAGERRGRPATDKRQIIAELGAGRTDDVAAKQAGFGNRETYRQASAVVEHGEPELVEAMDAGTISIADAANVASEPPAKQREAVDAVKNGKSKTASRAIADSDPGSVDGAIRRERAALRTAKRALKDFDKNFAEFAKGKRLASLCKDVRERLAALQASFDQLTKAARIK